MGRLRGESTGVLMRPARYRIRVQGYLGPQWAAFFAGLTMSWEHPDQTTLSGLVADQSALHGILNTIRDLGLPLLEVLRLQDEAPDNQAP